MRHLALVSLASPVERVTPVPRWSWGFSGLIGRITELSTTQPSSLDTIALGVVLDAQRAGETAAWITTTHSAFFPPDAAAFGVDLRALVVIRVVQARGSSHAAAQARGSSHAAVQARGSSHAAEQARGSSHAAVQARGLGRAADHLARSGGFGLIVIDLASCEESASRVTLGAPLQSRLLGLAQKHRTAVVVLSHKADDEPSLSSLVSLRGHVSRTLLPQGRLAYELRAIKDKHRAPGWVHREVVDGPPGLR